MEKVPMTGAERVKKYREQNPKKRDKLNIEQEKDLRKIFHPLTYLMLHLQVRMRKQIKTMLVIQVILMEVSKHPKEKADNLVGITPLILLHLDILDNIFLG
jgi:hypothetical protein